MAEFKDGLPKEIADLPCKYLLMKYDENGKKIIKGNSKEVKWSFEIASKKQKTKEFNDYSIIRAIDLTDSDYFVVDIDEDISLEKLYKTLPLLEETCCSKGNRKGYHFYFKNNKIGKYKKEIKCLKIEGDIITDLIFERPDSKFNHNNLFEIPDEELKTMFISDDRWKQFISKNTDTPLKNIMKSNIKNNKSSNDNLIKLLDLISIDYIDNRADWVKIVLACKKCEIDIDKVIEISKKSKSYDDKGFFDVWGSYSQDMITASAGTIHYYAKESNPIEYEKLTFNNTIEKLIWNSTDCDCARFYLNISKGNHIHINKMNYFYIDGNWLMIDKSNTGVLRKNINEVLNKKINDFKWYAINEPSLSNDDDFMKALTTTIKKVNSTTGINNIKTEVISILEAEGYDKEDVFDKHPYIFCFNNKAFDLQTNKEVTITKDMYITQKTKYNYEEPPQNKIDLIDKLFNKIFPDPEIKRCYLSILFSSLTGIRPEKFIVANGDGRNGKGLINELLFATLGDYSYKLPVEFLTQKSNASSSSANPMLWGCNKKRCILSSEPEDGSSLQMAKIKDITGSNIIKARDLYSSDGDVNMLQTLLLECNQKLRIAGKIDNSVLERVLDVPFVSTFTSNPELVDEKNNIYPADTKYKTDKWKRDYRCAMFKYIINNADKELYIPDVIIKRSKEYVMSSDILYNWVNSNYNKVDDVNAFVKIKDMYALFKTSDCYINMNKADKRYYNKTLFNTTLKKHLVFKKCYRDDKLRINGKQIECERLQGYKLNEDDSDNDLEEDEM